MRLPGWKIARQSARWLRSRLAGKALILGYHRVASPPHDPFGICVAPPHFESHLEMIRRFGTPIGLADLVEGLKVNRLPRRAVAITFDDGYLDNLIEARPLLERFDIPATVFVTTGSLGGIFWWDELEAILLAPGSLPETLRLTAHEVEYTWNVEPCSRSRHDLLLSLYNWLLPLGAGQREAAMVRLRAWVEAPTATRRLLLKAEELPRLADGGLIEIGAHSVTHPLLPQLPREAQRREIRESKELLECLLGREIRGFAYPNGACEKTVRELVREAGFAFGCESTSDLVRTGADRWRLPRFWIPDWDGKAFGRWLMRWLPA
jgi:peptidoglycan/xylan/chitin deacetylase (PgdA/CDA1 family)